MNAENIEFIRGFLDALRPQQLISVSDWAELHRYLAPTASAEPGRWRNSRTPYLVEPMTKLSASDGTQKVVCMKGTQLGYTEMGNNWLGYVMHVAPGAFLFVMPTDDTVKRNSKIRINPMIEATPVLREKVAKAKSRDGDNNIYQKSFPGGVVMMAGANSSAGLRSLPVKYLMLDEIDAYPHDLDGEGSPIDLAIKRTSTYKKKKILLISTPKIAGASAIEREFAATDQRKYFVPCPHCGTLQHLQFEQMRWELGKPKTARIQCSDCGELIEERDKTKMLEAGQWIATKPENASDEVVGYHMNALYSPYGWFSWAEAVEEWEKAQTDVNKLKTFTNTVLGECYEEKGEKPEWEHLYNRREKYEANKIPTDVIFLTAGVDVQKDRVELEVVGWCSEKRSYSIDYRVILGDTAHDTVWAELAKVVDESWQRADGFAMGLQCMAVDSGYNTSVVYDFCNRYTGIKVIPVKGSDTLGIIASPPRAVDYNRAGRKIRKISLWNIGVSVLKSELYGWLRLGMEPDSAEPIGYCHFPERDAHYFKGLVSEELRWKPVRGFRKYEWHKTFERNEPLDCRIYARAAAHVLGMDRFTPDQLRQMFQPTGKNEIAQKKKKRKSSYW